MSIFDHVVFRAENRQHLDRITEPSITYGTKATGEIRPYVTDSNEEYVAEIKIQQKFWANTAQLPHRHGDAKRALAAFLYTDILRHIHTLRLAIMSGDKDGAMDIIALMQKETEWE